MPDTITGEWQQIALYAVAAALALILLQRIPYVGRVIRFVLSLGLLAFFIFLLIQQAPYEPNLARLTNQLGLDHQAFLGSTLEAVAGEASAISVHRQKETLISDG